MSIDENCGKSDWSDPLELNMPKYRDIRFIFFNRLLYRLQEQIFNLKQIININ